MGMTFYINGFSEQCPFCSSGKTDVDKVTAQSMDIDRKDKAIYYLQTVKSETVLFDSEEKNLKRAPPA